MYRLLGLMALVFLLLPGPASADQGVVFRFCNTDKKHDIYVAASHWNWGWGTVRVEGWDKIGKDSCRNLNHHTGFYWRHYFVFQRSGQILSFAPSETKLGPFTFTGATKPTTQKFCVNLKDAFRISETVFDIDRSVKCRGSESLVEFNFRIDGVDGNGPYQEYRITLPPTELPGDPPPPPPAPKESASAAPPPASAGTTRKSDLFNKSWFDAAGFMRNLVVAAAPLEDTYPITEDATIEGARMYWHDKAFVVRVQSPAWRKPGLYLYFLTDGKTTEWLDGTVAPIFRFVAGKPLELTPITAAEYLRFFTFFVRGEEGPFLIVESAKDRYLPVAAASASASDMAQMAAMEKRLRAADCEVVSAGAECDAMVYYARALFESSFRIKPDGRVEMLDDNAVTPDLPASVDAPLK